MGVWHEEHLDRTIKHSEWISMGDIKYIINNLPSAEEGDMLVRIHGEYKRARQKFSPMRGPHEGYAVILEELDEMWDAIKANDIPDARKECLQVAAMCLAFLLEVKE